MSASKPGNPKISRRHPRFNVDLPAEYRMIGEQSWLGGRLVNLSKSGSCLLSPKTYPIGSLLELQIHTDKEATANIRKVMAMVRWTEEDRIGLEFLG